MATPAFGKSVSALSHRDGRVTATYKHIDVLFRDGRGAVRDLLVGACDVCGEAIVIPAACTPRIGEARRKVEEVSAGLQHGVDYVAP